MREIAINGRWPLVVPDHRANRPEWPWWEATRLAAMRTVIGEGSVVYDIGAEEGDFPALWATWGAQVVLAEPNPRVWPNIKAIWKANNLPDPVCWSGFVGDQPGDPSAAGPWPESADGPLIGDHGFCQLGERPDLPQIRLDDLVSVAPAPTVITMDVEGSEHLVVDGARNTLTAFRPHVFVSIHPEFMEHHYGVSDGVAHMSALMTGLGYREQFLSIDHEHHYWYQP